MKKSFQSRSTCTDIHVLPKINFKSLRKSNIKRQTISLKKNLNFSRNKEMDIENNNNKTEEIKIEDKNNDNNNKINGIFSYENKNYDMSNKKQKEVDNDKKRENMSSYFINDFTNKIFLKKKINSLMAKEEKRSRKKDINILIYPQVTNEKIEEIKSRSIKRLIEDKKDEMMFKKLLEDYEEEKHPKRKSKINVYNLDFQIAVNQKKALSILEDIGVIEVKNSLINKRKKPSFPKKHLQGNSTYTIKSYQNKRINDKIQKNNEITENYFVTKIKNYMEENNNGNDYIKLIKILKERKLNKILNKLDKSKSSINIIEKKKYLLSNKENETMINNTNTYFSKGENTYARYKTINMRLKNNIKFRDFNRNSPNIIKYNNRYNRINEKMQTKISLNKNIDSTNYENIYDSNLNNNKIYLHKDI